MFPQLKKLNNESGIVLFIVLMTAIIIMIFSVGILTESANEVNYSQQQIDQIESDELAKGVFWNEYSAMVAGGNPNWSAALPATVGRTYTATIANSSVASGTTPYTVTVSYDTD